MAEHTPLRRNPQMVRRNPQMVLGRAIAGHQLRKRPEVRLSDPHRKSPGSRTGCRARMIRNSFGCPGASSTKLPEVVVEMTITEDPPISPAHWTEVGLVRPTSIRRCVYELVDQQR